jgi:hypothetical protein
LIWFPDASARSLFDLPFDLEEEADMFLWNAELSPNYKALTLKTTKLKKKHTPQIM